MNVLFVGGKFNKDGGDHSGYAGKLGDALEVLFEFQPKWTDYDHFINMNGGSYNSLTSLLERDNWDIIFWFADVPNDEPKLVQSIKQRFYKTILVESKNNRDGKYSRFHLIARMLQHKANLLVEFTGSDRIAATILDPLGNCFTRDDRSIDSVAVKLFERCVELTSFTRIGCKNIGIAVGCGDLPEFYEIVRKHSDTFHTLIHAANTSRFLGNVSFRCESGFPSVRAGDLMFVSQRNVDKRHLNHEAMVAVLLNLTTKIEYYGDVKPSVDTPIQRLLYSYYYNVRYMLHSHVYVDGAVMTKHVIPCGAVEEFLEIISLYPERETTDICVNLRGHGSIALTSSVDFLKDVSYIARPFPEDM